MSSAVNVVKEKFQFGREKTFIVFFSGLKGFTLKM